MRTKKRLLLIPAAVLLAGASSIGFVHASSGGTSHAPISAQVDTNTGDNVQQGDQNAPEVAGAGEKADAVEVDTPETGTAAEATTPDGDNVQQGDQSGPDSGK